MLCHLLDCLLVPENTPADCSKDWHDIFFVFACVWAFGSAMFQDTNVDYRVGNNLYLYLSYIMANFQRLLGPEVLASNTGEQISFG